MEGDLILVNVDFYEGYEQLLNRYPMKAGQVFRCSVSGTSGDGSETTSIVVYIDVNNSTRFSTNSIIFLANEDARVQLSNPDDTKLYVTLDTKTFYVSSYGAWNIVTNVTDIKHIFFLNNLTVSTIYKKANGNTTPYAPRTIGSAVYLSSGATVEDLARNITRLSTSIAHVTATMNNQTSFEVPYPFENYMTLGNSMMVFVGTTFIVNTRYSLSSDYSVLYFLNGMNVKKGRDVTFVFLYNSRPMLNGSAPLSYMTYDGGYMADATLPIQKMEKYSSSLRNKDLDCVATSKAVADLYETLLSKIDKLDSKYAVYAKAFGTSTAYQVDIPNFVLTDFSIIHMRANVACGNNPTLKVNNGTAYPIYATFTDRLMSGDVAENEVITLTFNEDEGRFYVISDTGVVVVSTQFTYTTTKDGEDTFDISNLDISPIQDILEVYQDGFMLTEGIHYTNNHNGTITLLGYTAEEYTEFTFRSLSVEKSMPSSASTYGFTTSHTLNSEVDTVSSYSVSTRSTNALYSTGKWDVLTDDGRSNNLSFVYNGNIVITMTPTGEIIANKYSTREQ